MPTLDNCPVSATTLLNDGLTAGFATVGGQLREHISRIFARDSTRTTLFRGDADVSWRRRWL
jgi:hypothetical protein